MCPVGSREGRIRQGGRSAAGAGRGCPGRKEPSPGGLRQATGGRGCGHHHHSHASVPGGRQCGGQVRGSQSSGRVRGGCAVQNPGGGRQNMPGGDVQAGAGHSGKGCAALRKASAGGRKPVHGIGGQHGHDLSSDGMGQCGSGPCSFYGRAPVCSGDGGCRGSLLCISGDVRLCGWGYHGGGACLRDGGEGRDHTACGSGHQR